LIIVTMGPHPSACAAYMLVDRARRAAEVFELLDAFQIFVISEPPAQGTTSGPARAQPSCSTISKP